MTRGGSIRMHPAALMAMGATTPATARDATAGPEGIEWHLVSSSSNGETLPVPWPIDATLVPEDCQAGGHFGCHVSELEGAIVVLQGQVKAAHEPFSPRCPN